jgi:hypothetical protein
VRDFTEEELKEYNESLDKLFKPMGINIFERPKRIGEVKKMILSKKDGELLERVVGLIEIGDSKFLLSEGEEVDAWDLTEYADAVVIDEITGTTRWDVYKRKVLKFGDKFLELTWSEGATEAQDYDNYDLEMREVFPKEKTITVYE